MYGIPVIKRLFLFASGDMKSSISTDTFSLELVHVYRDQPFGLSNPM